MAPFLTFLVLLALPTGIVVVQHRRGWPILGLHQFRPAAPLAGHLQDPSSHDARRAYRDLQAAASHSEPGIDLGRTLATKQAS